MQTSLDRYLKDKGYEHSITRDKQFLSSREVIEGKARSLREAGRGKRPNKSRSLTKEEEESLWGAGKLGNDNPDSLINTLWWELTQYFGLRGRQEHHSMKLEDFELLTDDDGTEFIQFKEGPTKTRQSGLKTKMRDFQPRMVAIGGDRCPVYFFKQYVARRPQALRNSGPFYLAINHNRRPDDQVWFKAQPMGVNRINTMMHSIIAGTSLEGNTVKRFTNHSARKTLMNKMKKSKVERTSIMKVTGHRNIQSLHDYDEADEDEQDYLSYAILRRNNQPNENQVAAVHQSRAFSFHQPAVQQFQSSSSASLQYSQQLASTMGLQDTPGFPFRFPQLSSTAGSGFLNHFHNCQVPFNFGQSSSDASTSSDPQGKRQNPDN